VEELWKNCRKILWALKRQRSGEELWKNHPSAKSFYNSSTILPRHAAGRGPAKSFYNFSTIFPRWLFILVRKQSFHCDFVEKLLKNLVHAKFREGFFFLRLTSILRGKAGKYTWGIIVEKSKKNRRRIVEIFGECRPSLHVLFCVQFSGRFPAKGGLQFYNRTYFF
jgi:hypothetical protein